MHPRTHSMGTRISTGGRSQPKVVVIETRHVRTDTEHFKSVVQSLTGKDSTLSAVVPEKPAISYPGGVTAGPCGSVVDVRIWPSAAEYLPALAMQPPPLLLPAPSPSYQSLNSVAEISSDDYSYYMLHQN
ncbi:uncharacterized protein LOC122008511 [Zingiber officinale]|uniref:uncharacterized protein LOC122008511 n=1 Tax=Zingiber officinale TaxID=94328 RepID=UPI001C4C2955|nr:uncharacterized protein LOC122008511 [Zingiber officinale]